MSGYQEGRGGANCTELARKSQPWKVLVGDIPTKRPDAKDDQVIRLQTEQDQHNGLGG